MVKVLLNNKLTIKGVETNEINIDFNNITGNTMIAAENEVRAMGDTTPSVFLSMRFQASLAAKIIGVTVDDIMALNGTDFKNIILPVANFLLSQD